MRNEYGCKFRVQCADAQAQNFRHILPFGKQRRATVLTEITPDARRRVEMLYGLLTREKLEIFGTHQRERRKCGRWLCGSVNNGRAKFG